ncbi:hypothetical protein [Amaricoccus solimangrovi]|uniref:Uncharacterized protein n=1 Tax=Amaricoccus solimangrovi TaxID=2589815 RepID=A0A501X126_9RHOB|nr:hypothetical protein [Amaricoccus solimangrovi]TPE53046.1 hypothetical protein FJM51_03200 [Amaricoccus solimangrovi]
MASEDEPVGMIIVCAGPPVCGLEGDEAVEAANRGCPHCKRLAIYDDGEEVDQTIKGGRA